MGILLFEGAFAIVERQGECGSKTAGMHVSQPVPKGVNYALGYLSGKFDKAVFKSNIKVNFCF